MREILVLGKSGQLARELARAAPQSGWIIRCCGRAEIDLADAAAAERAVRAREPAAVINAAAYTAVDKAESEEDAAYALNASGPAAAARACAALGVPFVHVSTDYVFDGLKSAPYVETDPVAPSGAYGRTKAQGEALIAAVDAPWAIVRTSWVYSGFGANFVKTMLRLAATRDEVGVVADQHGRPTHAGDLAEACLGLVALMASGETRARGVFHYAGAGDAVWADLAEATFAASRELGGAFAAVRRITTADYPTPAKRPANSRLDTAKIEALGIAVPPWRGRVRAAVKEALAAQ